MKELWSLKQKHDEEISILKKEIKKLDKEISSQKKELKKWTDYKETGSNRLDTQIKLLKHEIVSMKDHFEIITGMKNLF
jgi:hypothetical protein